MYIVQYMRYSHLLFLLDFLWKDCVMLAMCALFLLPFWETEFGCENLDFAPACATRTAQKGIREPFCRAGHATILSRQWDHVFRVQSCLYLSFYYFCCGYTPSRNWGLTNFRIFSGPWLVLEALLRCRVVAKLKSCRVPSSAILSWQSPFLCSWAGRGWRKTPR